MKKMIIAIACVVSIYTLAFAEVTLEATGYDWLKYNWGEKITLVSEIFNELGGEKNQKVEYAVDGLNGYYARVVARFDESDPQRDALLSPPCLEVMAKLFEEQGDESMKERRKKRFLPPIPFLSD